jgi:hypothetical protein
MPLRASCSASSKAKPASHQASRSAGVKPSRFHSLGSERSRSAIRVVVLRAESSQLRASWGSKPLSAQVRATTGAKLAPSQSTASWGLKP